ncbi:MAG TPA: methyltransferase domain-containing protein [Marmoricola sp.]|nr:methyltransferase domain-containing protein [Marmoricola sp.]
MASDNTFEPVVGRWLGHLGSVRDIVRQELVAGQLAAHLPHPESRVLDVGCGQGTQAIRLARLGHQVIGVDPSAELLERAQASTEAEPAEVRERLSWRQGDLFTLEDGGWDVVCCHGVLMYLSEPQAAVAALVRRVRPGGLVSLLTRNQAGIAMRAGMTGQWQQALDGFDATHYANRLGVVGARADSPDAVRVALEAAGATVEKWYGVRLFTDHWEKREPPPELGEVIAAEAEAGRRDPYRQLAALTHTLATRLP